MTLSETARKVHDQLWDLLIKNWLYKKKSMQNIDFDIVNYCTICNAISRLTPDVVKSYFVQEG